MQETGFDPWLRTRPSILQGMAKKEEERKKMLFFKVEECHHNSRSKNPFCADSSYL